MTVYDILQSETNLLSISCTHPNHEKMLPCGFYLFDEFANQQLALKMKQELNENTQRFFPLLPA